jgi:hypothetical protein
VVHRTPKRLRLKVPPRRHDEAFFAGLQQELIKQRGIISVDLNSLTGSVVIVHDGTLDPRPKPRQGRASFVNRLRRVEQYKGGQRRARDVTHCSNTKERAFAQPTVS